ncbi:MAG: glyceraldehyde 3-phosphate dehydrogenase NAD-binding domain-containing protein, partial [Cyanobacteriota bacterium]
MKIGINGFGRIGRLVFRALWGRAGIELVHVNDCGGDAATAAHLLAFDSVHGRWSLPVAARPVDPGSFLVDGRSVGYSRQADPMAVPWHQAGVEMVLECRGRFKTPETLQPYFDQLGLQRVVVACPVKGEIAGTEALNVVFGIN